MHFFDPARPRIGSYPAFCPEGPEKPLGILPDLFIRPLAEGRFEISGWFCIALNRASRKHYSLGQSPKDEQLAIFTLESFFSVWTQDPEWVAKNYFLWEKAKDEPGPQTKAWSSTTDLEF